MKTLYISCKLQGKFLDRYLTVFTYEKRLFVVKSGNHLIMKKRILKLFFPLTAECLQPNKLNQLFMIIYFSQLP